ncbi:ATP-dependent RNA helicase DeaD [Sinobacterium norvegicum]|uniref:ATP-dependent RNA helicase DeaD n=1 Tax=Sinobacterium norvegicum TaxID=1641715 RepID=A0ABN8EIU0_9GAMM|nr:DEAD/DEAH box helicase [Sinobacterium norvegicum]CAH0991074.1 ATP-dependent RNA helicase DeaD [Sinobacterium norvegicum]
MSEETPVLFKNLGLAEPLVRAVTELGYESPSPIQADSIPHLLEGRDIIGQAQTGTGKTAAFALPLMSRMDPTSKDPQLLVLAPTRELAIQVSEAFQSYAKHMKGFHVLPIYGGQSYDTQLRHLRRGVHVVVGTPGRVMDHIRRGTLKLGNLKSLVLDEADEMLRMGFIDDVDWILEHTPSTRQIALFSATMPNEVRKVAKRHLTDPVEIKIAAKTQTATTIRQRYTMASGMHQKLDALTRILEAEEFDGVIVFVRTKTATVELAEKLQARGHAAEALNGDIAQNQRERTVDKLKKGGVDILVATDVVARGLDVERISHVINYDIPYDTEAYVHRIGRTGRAGRSGDAILFVAPRERRMLRTIENATKQTIEQMAMPSTIDINASRVSRFKQRIVDTLAAGNNSFFENLISEMQQETEVDSIQIAAALAKLLQGNEPLLLTDSPKRERRERDDSRSDRERGGERRERNDRGRERRSNDRPVSAEAIPLKGHPDVDMMRYRIEVGHEHGVKPGNIVGAIANEAGIESDFIGNIEIFDEFSTIDLPDGMPKETHDKLKKTWICQQRINLRPMPKKGKNEGSNHSKFSDEPKKRKPKKKSPRTGDKKTFKPKKRD